MRKCWCALHQGVSQALGVALGGVAHPSAAVLAILKGVQLGAWDTV